MEGTDFKYSNETLTFQPGGSNILCAQQVIINDILVEDVERFQGTLTSDDNAVNLVEDETCISIIDDDGKMWFCFK